MQAARYFTTNIDNSILDFSDMSAFTSDDMYAVNGKGDLGRFDGVSWHRILRNETDYQSY